MIVIKTRPGYASSIAYNIDNHDIPEILGTIAGDDTIFLVKKEDASEEALLKSLANAIPELKQDIREQNRISCISMHAFSYKITRTL